MSNRNTTGGLETQISKFFSADESIVRRFVEAYHAIVERFILNKQRYYDTYVANREEGYRRWSITPGVTIDVVISDQLPSLAGVKSNQNADNLDMQLYLSYRLFDLNESDVRFVLAHELGHIISNRGLGIGDMPELDDVRVFGYLAGEASADLVAILLTGTTLDEYVDITNRLRPSKSGSMHGTAMLQSMTYTQMQMFNTFAK